MTAVGVAARAIITTDARCGVLVGITVTGAKAPTCNRVGETSRNAEVRKVFMAAFVLFKIFRDKMFVDGFGRHINSRCWYLLAHV